MSGIGGPGANGGRGVEGEGGTGNGTGNKSGDGITGFPGKATNGATVGKAGRFLGDVEVLGTLSKAGGSFKIDHPLDPENKYLSHSFVESPDMMIKKVEIPSRALHLFQVRSPANSSCLDDFLARSISFRHSYGCFRAWR